MRRIVFRADGNEQIGLGHIMRILSLIEILNYEYDCLFISNNVNSKLKKIISSECTALFIEEGNRELEIKLLNTVLKPDDIFVLDGYLFDEAYQRQIKNMVHKLVMIDDNAETFFHADVIINHGLGDNGKIYQTIPQTKIFSGFKYAIVRKDFLVASQKKRIIDNIDTVFICFGGSDPFHITSKVLEACLKCEFIRKVYVVLGAANQDVLELRKLVSTIYEKEIVLAFDIGSKDIVELVRSSQIAISTSSTIALEICCVKSGLITGTVVNNQNQIHKQIIDNKCGISVGNWNHISIDQIVETLVNINDIDIVNEMMYFQSEIIDGKAAERLINIFNELAA